MQVSDYWVNKGFFHFSVYFNISTWHICADVCFFPLYCFLPSKLLEQEWSKNGFIKQQMVLVTDKESFSGMWYFL